MRKYLLLIALITFFFSCSKEETNSKDEKTEETVSWVLLKNQKVPTSYLQDSNGLFNIYLPSDWETTKETYPILYLFHGMGGDNNDWAANVVDSYSGLHGGDVVSTTRVAVSQGKIGKFIIVMPNAYNSFYVDGYDKVNYYESFFFKEFVPYIEKTYPVKTGKNNTAIAGLSMGGFGASYYAFTYPDKYCLCYAMSGAVEGIGQAITPSVPTIFQTKGYNETNYSTLPEYYMDCGNNDSLVLTSNRNVDAYLTNVKFPHSYKEFDGVHDWKYWRACYQRLIPLLAKYFKP